MFNTDSFGNVYFPAGVSVASIPATTGTQSRVLVPGPNGRISSASISQLITQSGGNLVSSIFGRTGAVTAAVGDYNTDQVTEGQSLYFSASRARKVLSVTTFNTSGPATYDSSTGIINIPQYGSGAASPDNFVPLTRKISINGQTADLSVDRMFSVEEMVYPSIGIPVSNGTSWAPSITNNSANWNTAFSWGNHANLYPLYNGTGATGTWVISISGNADTVTNGVYTTGSYSNPTWMTSLDWSKITDRPTTLSGYGITDAQSALSGTGIVKSTAGTISYLTDNSTNWNTAYGWGDHSTEGYLTSFTETDPIWTAEKVNYYTKIQSDARYLQSYTETDPIWTSEKTNYALKTYVDTSISNLIDTAPTTLNTLNELAAALGDDANFSTTITTLIGTKEPAITAGTTAQYWRGDKTWQTLPIYTLSGLGGVPTSRTLTINSVSYDLNADRSWTIPTYSLPIASGTVLGGIKVGSNLSINATTGVLDATFTYTLPTASATVLGGIKVGSNLSIDANGVLSAGNSYVLPIASPTVLGGIKVGTNLSIDANGVLSSTDTNTTYSNFTRTVSGLVPNPGGSTTNRYLREDGTWVIPPDTDTNTWVANSVNVAGYVAAPGAVANKVWKTDGSGNPAWRDDADTTYTLAGLGGLPLSGGIMTGAITLKEGVGNGLKFPNDIFGGSGDTAGMRLISRGGESMSLEVYLTNDADDWFNISVPNANGAKVNGNTIWHAGNLTNLDQLTNGPGYITSYVDTNTTYSLTIPASTTKIRLTGSDASTSDITFTGSGATTITRTSATEFTISSTDTDTNTTYSNFTRTVAGLVPNPGGSTTNRYLREDGTWVVPPDTDTDTNTWNANTRDVAGYVSAPGAIANKVWKTDASGNPGWRDDADTDTNTTYTNGAGLTLSGTTFSVTKTITASETADTIALRNGSGQLVATGFFQASSRTLKTNITPFTRSALDIIREVTVVSFNYKTDIINKHIGFIAEDTPEELSTRSKNVMDSNNTIGVLLKAIQELESKIKELEAKCNEK